MKEEKGDNDEMFFVLITAETTELNDGQIPCKL